MGKRARNVPKRHQSHADKGLAICPECGSPSQSSKGVPVAKLIESHTELCKTLRQSGREMLQFVDSNSQSLVRIRHVLNAAERVRKELKSAYQLPGDGLGHERKPPETAKARGISKTSSAAEEKTKPLKPPHTRNSRQKRLTRPNSYRILNFPVRLALED